MGKSSFVGKVLNKITIKTKSTRNKSRFFTFFCFLCITSFVLCVFNVFDNLKSDTLTKYEFINNISEINCFFPICSLVFFLSILGIVSILTFCDINGTTLFTKWKQKLYLKRKLWWNNIKETDYKNHKTWFEKIFNIKDIKGSKHYFVIKLNLGHETLKEIDILSLIAKRISDSYNKYLDDFYTNWFRRIVKPIILFIFAIFIVFLLDSIYIYPYSQKQSSSDASVTFYKFVINGIINSAPLFKEDYLKWLSPLLITKIILVLFFFFLSWEL